MPGAGDLCSLGPASKNRAVSGEAQLQQRQHAMIVAIGACAGGRTCAGLRVRRACAALRRPAPPAPALLTVSESAAGLLSGSSGPSGYGSIW